MKILLVVRVKPWAQCPACQEHGEDPVVITLS